MLKVKPVNLEPKFRRMKESTVSQTERIFKVYRQGNYSVRSLAKSFGISFSTLRDRFKSLYGVDYTKHRSGEGTTMNILKEHQNCPRYTQKQQKEIDEWMNLNKEKLLSLSYHEQKDEKRTKIYSTGKMEKNSRSYCYLDSDVADNPFMGNNKYAPRIIENGEVFTLHEI